MWRDGARLFPGLHEKLPEEVARRLTEIDTEAVGHITRATGLNLVRLAPGSVRGRLASDAAFAQGHPGGERVPGAAGLRSPRAGRLAGARGGRTMKNPFPLLRLRAHGTHGAGPPHQRHVLGRPSR